MKLSQLAQDYRTCLKAGRRPFNNLFSKRKESGMTDVKKELLIIVTILMLSFLFMTWRTAYGAEVEIDISKIISIESSGNPNAYNKSSGCIGLMQINPKGALADWNSVTLPRRNIGDLYNPHINVIIGTWYINKRIPQMLKYYEIEDTLENRLISYNWGIGNLRKYLSGEKKLPRETINYLKRYKDLQ